MGKDFQQLLVACRNDDADKVKQILAESSRCKKLANEQETSTGYTLLHLAALNGCKKIVEPLLDNFGANVMIEDRQGNLPLHLAAWNGHVNIVRVLLERNNGVVNRQSKKTKDTPLHYAANYGHSDVVQVLIEKGADATLRNSSGRCPLDLAAECGRCEAARILLDACPQLVLNSTLFHLNFGSSYSPLHLAAANGKTPLVRILLDAGFDVNLLTENGTALHVAALNGKVDVVKLLLERDVNIEAKDFNGRTVLDLLEEHGLKKGDTWRREKNGPGGTDLWSTCALIIKGFSKTSDTQVAPMQSYLNLTNGHQPEVWKSGVSNSHTISANTPDNLNFLRSFDDNEDLPVKNLSGKSEKANSQLLLDRPGTGCSSISLTPEPTINVLPVDPAAGLNTEQRLSKAPSPNCSYQPPFLVKSQNFLSIGYDNVPSNILGYDNAGGSAGLSKFWGHTCSETPVVLSGKGSRCSNLSENVRVGNEQKNSPSKFDDSKVSLSPRAQLSRNSEQQSPMPRPDSNASFASDEFSSRSSSELTLKCPQIDNVSIDTLDSSTTGTSTSRKSFKKNLRVTWRGNYDNVPEVGVKANDENAVLKKTLSPIGVTSEDRLKFGVIFNVYYLGCSTIQSMYNATKGSLSTCEGTQNAVNKMKDTSSDLSSVSSVWMLVNLDSIRLFQHKPDHFTMTPDFNVDTYMYRHDMKTVACVFQDDQDLNCFAYVIKGPGLDDCFCHVFSVITSAMAREIVSTIGAAFHLAYCNSFTKDSINCVPNDHQKSASCISPI